MVLSKRLDLHAGCRRSQLRRVLRRDWSLHAMLLLPVAFLIVFRYAPMFGILMSFQKYRPARGILGSDWVGLQNFELLFSMPGFLSAIRNTVVIAMGKILLGILVPVTFSLLLNEIRHVGAKRTLQTIIYMPHFISWVLMAGIIIRILSQTGIVNQLLRALDMEPRVFLADKGLFQPLLLLTDTWKEFGYGTIIYLAAISAVSPSLYEAAMVDGAGHLRQTWHITLPGIAPTVILMTALSLGRILDAGFEQVFNLYSPVVYETGDIIDTFVYRMAFHNAQFSVSTAAGLFKSAISCVLIITSYRLAYMTSGYRIF